VSADWMLKGIPREIQTILFRRNFERPMIQRDCLSMVFDAELSTFNYIMAPHPSPTNPPDFFLQKFIKVDLCI
jgi:hypothetical protein